MTEEKNKTENSKSKIKNYLYLHLLLLSYSFCGVFSKLAAQNEFLSVKFCIYYGISIFILGLYAIFWQQILKKFTLTTAFFNKAVTIIWGMVFGILLFKEVITWNMILRSSNSFTRCWTGGE